MLTFKSFQPTVRFLVISHQFLKNRHKFPVHDFHYLPFILSGIRIFSII
jgi:hypothetical protein